MKSLFRFYNDEGEEACGVVLIDNHIVEVKNVHPEPTKGFEVDPEALVKYDEQMIGTWHTHPGQSSILSQEDLNCFQTWPSLVHYIVGNDGIRKYVVKDGAVIDANYTPR